MDSQEYDRMADLLIQIRKKMEHIILKDDSIDNGMKARGLHYLEQLLFIVDSLATWDQRGYL